MMNPQKSQNQVKEKSQKNQPSASSILLDVVRGYSVLEVNKKKYYFKHFSLIEMLSLDEFERDEFEKARDSGIQTEQQLIDSAINIGSWSSKKEEKIKSLEWTINHSTKALNKLTDPHQRSSFFRQIEGERKELQEVKEKRLKICAFSAEHLSQRKRFGEMMKLSLFYDKALKKGLKDKDIEAVATSVFSKFAELSDKDNILRAIYFTYFFDVFVGQSKNPLALFQKDFSSLTIFQKNLLSFSGSLLNKIKNSKIPKEIYGDPVKMFDYEEPKEPTGDKVTHGVDDLKRKMAARGGELKPEDLLT